MGRAFGFEKALGRLRVSYCAPIFRKLLDVEFVSPQRIDIYNFSFNKALGRYCGQFKIQVTFGRASSSRILRLFSGTLLRTGLLSQKVGISYILHF